jgi:hypothetical protein
MEYLKKSEYTGSHQGLRYRLEKVTKTERQQLKATVWPEPFGFRKTPEAQKTSAFFVFSEEGVKEAVRWMNERFLQERGRWEHAAQNWENNG